MADITTEELEELENEVVSKDDNIKTMQEFVSPESLYQELIASVKKYHPSTDISLIEKAYKTADTAHKGQVRKSGEAYIIHPLCVAIILAELELDKETIVAGLLHDVVEDTVMTVEEIASEFSEEIALLVDGVTKLGQLSYDADKVEVQAENLRKMFLAMAKDIRVILIKLADRLHNMRTLKYMTPEKQKEKARETMDIYAPIAQRLGISKIKIELDDLSLKYLEPEAYYDLVEKVALRKSVRDDYVQSLVKEVSKHIENAGIKAQIDGRAKHFFSIYKKMVNQHKTLDQIYDLFAIRIIVDNVKDCYAALADVMKLQSGSDFVSLIKDPEKLNVPDNSYADETCENIIAQLKESFTDMPQIVRRAVMSAVLSQLPVFFNNTDEICEYINLSLEQCNDAAEKMAVIEVMKMIMRG